MGTPVEFGVRGYRYQGLAAEKLGSRDDGEWVNCIPNADVASRLHFAF
jgi:hypothetical protein